MLVKRKNKWLLERQLLHQNQVRNGSGVAFEFLLMFLNG